MISDSNKIPTNKRDDPWDSVCIAVVCWAFLLAAIGLSYFNSRPIFQFDELALGKASTSIFGNVDGRQVQCQGPEDAGRCLASLEESGSTPIYLWMGNSMLHAINQMQAGDQTAPMLLHQELKPRGVSLFSISIGSANVEEHYLAFEYLSAKLPRFDGVLIGLVFDDFRETGFRAGYTPWLLDEDVVGALESSSFGRKSLAAGRGQTLSSENVGLSALKNTPQEKVELYLNEWLSEQFDVWSNRSQMRGKLFSTLYVFRNFLLGIDAQSKRKIIAGRYRRNLTALKTLIAKAKSKDMRVVLYIAPIRSDIEIPYVESEYQKFKRDIEEISIENDISYYNFESIIPANYWGEKGVTNSFWGKKTEVDFMHFQAPAHQILSNTLFDKLQPDLPQSP